MASPEKGPGASLRYPRGKWQRCILAKPSSSMPHSLLDQLLRGLGHMGPEDRVPWAGWGESTGDSGGGGFPGNTEP